MKRYLRERYLKSSADFRPFDRWDLMKHYRQGIHDQDHAEIIHDLRKYELEAQDKSEVVTTAKKLVRARKIAGESWSIQNPDRLFYLFFFCK